MSFNMFWEYALGNAILFFAIIGLIVVIFGIALLASAIREAFKEIDYESKEKIIETNEES